MALLQVNSYSNWITKKHFKRMMETAEFKTEIPQVWIFLKSQDTNLNAGVDDVLGSLEMGFKMDRDELYAFLLEELDKGKGVAGILVLDGLYAHPEALGRALLKLGKSRLK